MTKYIKFIVLIALAAFILWFFGRNLDWQEVGMSLREADPLWLLGASAIICIGYFLRAVRWHQLLKPISESSLRELFATTTVGFTAIFLIGRAGEIVRPMWLPMRDRRVKPTAAVVTIGMERVFDLASLIAFFSISLIWFQTRAGHEAEYAYIRWVGNAMFVGAIAFIIFLVVYQWKSEPIIGWFSRVSDTNIITSRLRLIVLGLMEHLATSLIGRRYFWSLGGPFCCGSRSQYRRGWC